MQNKIDNIIQNAFDEFQRALIKLKIKSRQDGTFEVPKSPAGPVIKQKDQSYACVLTFIPPNDEADTTHTMATVLQTLQQGRIKIPDSCIKIINNAHRKANPHYDKLPGDNPKQTIRLPLGNAIENTIVIWGPTAFKLLNQHIKKAEKEVIVVEIIPPESVDNASREPHLDVREKSADEEIAHVLADDPELRALEEQLAAETHKQQQLLAAERASKQAIEREKAQRKQALEAQLRETRLRNAELEKKQARDGDKDQNPREPKRSAFSKMT